MRSNLFLNNITVIDHAFIGKEGELAGGSYSLSCVVSGLVEGPEAVVVDFSTVKKEIKSLIDDQDTGFDHKLWIIDGISGISEMGRTEIATPQVILNFPRDDAFIFMDNFLGVGFSVRDIAENSIGRYLTHELQKIHPEIDIMVKCRLSEEFSTLFEGEVHAFRYTHGLKNSTSYGCQNIAHGHLSFIEYFGINGEQVDPRTAPFFDTSHNLVFIDRNDIVSEDQGSIGVSYSSPRGVFRAEYNKESNNIMILDSDTTIENIVEWFINQNREALIEAGVAFVGISEGLNKGAFSEVQSNIGE